MVATVSQNCHQRRQVWQFLRLMELRCDYVHDALILGPEGKGKQQRRQKSHPRFAERLATRFAERSNQWRWFLKFMCIHSAYVINRNYIILCLKAFGRCIPHLTHWRWLSTFLWQDGPGSSEQSAKGHLSIWTKVLETYLPGCQEVDWHAIEIWARATVPWLWFDGWGEEWVLAELLWGTLLAFQYCLGKWDWTTCVRYAPRQVWACLCFTVWSACKRENLEYLIQILTGPDSACLILGVLFHGWW